jgi:hypothetical protein
MLLKPRELADFFARVYRERNMVPDEDKVASKVLAVLDGLDRAQPDLWSGKRLAGRPQHNARGKGFDALV